MSDPYLVASIALGLLGIVALFVVAVIKKRQRPELSDGVIAFLAAAGISSGVKVCFLSLNPNVLQSIENERAYVFLGGLAVVWVSLDTIWKLLIKR